MPSANNCLLFFCQIAPLFLAKSPPTTLIMLWSLPSFSVVSPCCWLLFCFVSPAPAPACATFGSAKGGSSGAGFAYQTKILLLLLADAAFAVITLPVPSLSASVYVPQVWFQLLGLPFGSAAHAASHIRFYLSTVS